MGAGRSQVFSAQRRGSPLSTRGDLAPFVIPPISSTDILDLFNDPALQREIQTHEAARAEIAEKRRQLDLIQERVGGWIPTTCDDCLWGLVVGLHQTVSTYTQPYRGQPRGVVLDSVSSPSPRNHATVVEARGNARAAGREWRCWPQSHVCHGSGLGEDGRV